MLEFARTLIGKKFCSDVGAIPSSIDRLSRAVESLESQLMELNSIVQRGVPVDVTSMPILIQQGEKNGNRDNTMALCYVPGRV